MTRVILDEATLSKLLQVQERVELCDATGRTWGYFTPVADRSLYEGLEVPFTEEELRIRDQDSRGRTLPEILTDLEKRA
jgi:hypothetical protein